MGGNTVQEKSMSTESGSKKAKGLPWKTGFGNKHSGQGGLSLYPTYMETSLVIIGFAQFLLSSDKKKIFASKVKSK